jgi:hypothetical protein
VKYIRIYTGSDGLSHFEDVDVPLPNVAGGLHASQLIKAAGIFFRESDASFDANWHNAPRRQFVVFLEGSTEFVVSDGTTRRFGPGDVILAEDVTGKGHISRSTDRKLGRSLAIPL